MTTRQLDGAVEAGDLLDAFRVYGILQVDIAQVARVDPKTVYTWKAHDVRPRARVYDRLDGLREVVRVLSDSLTDRGVGQWLRARNRLLDGQRPLEVLHEGQQQAVLAAARSFVDGSYV